MTPKILWGLIIAWIGVGVVVVGQIIHIIVSSNFVHEEDTNVLYGFAGVKVTFLWATVISILLIILAVVGPILMIFKKTRKSGTTVSSVLACVGFALCIIYSIFDVYEYIWLVGFAVILVGTLLIYRDAKGEPVYKPEVQAVLDAEENEKGF